MHEGNIDRQLLLPLQRLEMFEPWTKDATAFSLMFHTEKI